MRAKGVFRASIGMPGWAEPNSPVLVPSSKQDAELLNGLNGKRVMVHIHQARYPEHHRQVFGFLRKLSEATGKSVDRLELECKILTGYADVKEVLDGGRVLVPRSISYESMGQKEFQEWWDNVLEVVKEKIFPNLTAREWRDAMKVLEGKD